VYAGLKVGVGVERLAEPHEKMLRLAQTGVDTTHLHPFSVFSLDSGRHPRLGQVTRQHRDNDLRRRECGTTGSSSGAPMGWRRDGCGGNSISGLPAMEF
jgi:hypothetical protein